MAEITWHLDEDEDFRRATDALVDHARAMAPRLRARAAEAEVLRRQTEETLAEAEPFFPALVPKRWGGLGLGSRALCEVARELAHGDASSAWTIAFLMEHSWMACHLPWEAQEELFAERPFILAAAPLQPGGKAVRVDGGFEVTATFRYASGVWNAEWTFGTAMVEEGGQEVPWTFLFPLSEVTVNDDWFMSGMAATSSSSVTAVDVFVPERRAIQTEIFTSSDLHPGAVHEESFLRYPQLGSITIMMAAIVLGSAEAAIEIARERLTSGRVMGGALRVDSPLSRVRWGEAMEKVKCAQLVYRDVLERTIPKCDALEEWSETESGHTELDIFTIVKLSHEAIDLVVDGLGSSIYRLEDPLQRYHRDVDVVSNHVALERDGVSERGTRLILGLGGRPSDPPHLRPVKRPPVPT